MTAGISHRWTAIVTYKTARRSQVHQIEELEELHDIIEHGPCRDELDRIVVVLNRQSAEMERSQAH